MVLRYRADNAFGEKAPQIIDENPYRLSEIRGIGFKKADDVARKLGINFNDPKRLEACIIYLLREKIAGDGHVYTELHDVYDMLIEETTTEDGMVINKEAWDIALENLIRNERVVLFKDNLLSLTDSVKNFL